MTQATNPSRLESLELAGTPKERGIKHGEQYASEIAENVRTYLWVFDHYGIDEETVYEQAKEFVSIIEKENEEYAAEMRGISEGADLPVEDITILNARYEVMYSAYAEAAADLDEAKPDGCTAFAVRPEITADGRALMGQNWDWIPDVNIFVMDIRREEKPNMIALTEAGIVGGKIGINEAGIGMTLNGLISKGDGKEPFRKPYHVRFREALDSKRLDTAIAPFITKDRANSANVLLGHTEGEFINLELAPETASYLYPEDGLLTHANHFEDRSEVNSEFEKIVPDTLCRAPRLNRLLSKCAGDLDLEDAKTALQDHFGKPNSICAHIDESLPEPEQSQTNGCYLIDLEERRLIGTEGPPCENEFTTFEVSN